jgi:hypothetical protein
MKLTIQKTKRKTKLKPEPTISVTVPKHIEFRGGQTGKLISDLDNVVVQFRDGGTVGYPPELFETGRSELKQNKF